MINHIKQFSAPHTVLLLTFIDRFIASRYGPLIIFLIPYLNIYVSLYRAEKTILMYKKSIFETSYRICNSKICVAIHIVPENVLYVLMSPIYLYVIVTMLMILFFFEKFHIVRLIIFSIFKFQNASRIG